jgi:hypothetical protein
MTVPLVRLAVPPVALQSVKKTRGAGPARGRRAETWPREKRVPRMRMVSNQFHALARKGRILQHDGEPQNSLSLSPLPSLTLALPLFLPLSVGVCACAFGLIRVHVRAWEKMK